MLYVRFSFSLRKVEALLDERGVATKYAIRVDMMRRRFTFDSWKG